MPNQHTPPSRRVPARTVIKPIRWTEAEWAAIKKAARAAKLTESEYIRDCALQPSARTPPKEGR